MEATMRVLCTFCHHESRKQLYIPSLIDLALLWGLFSLKKWLNMHTELCFMIPHCCHYYNHYYYVICNYLRSEKMIQQSRTFITLVEDPGSVLSTHIGYFTTIYDFKSRESNTLLCPAWVPAYT